MSIVVVVVLIVVALQHLPAPTGKAIATADKTKNKLRNLHVDVIL